MPIYLVIESDDAGEAGPIVATSDPAVIRAALQALERRIFAGTITDVYQHPPLVAK